MNIEDMKRMYKQQRKQRNMNSDIHYIQRDA